MLKIAVISYKKHSYLKACKCSKHLTHSWFTQNLQRWLLQCILLKLYIPPTMSNQENILTIFEIRLRNLYTCISVDNIITLNSAN